MTKKGFFKNCIGCNKQYYVYPSEEKNKGRIRKYCSKECSWKSNEGIPTWNKGKHWSEKWRKEQSLRLKGNHCKLRTGKIVGCFTCGKEIYKEKGWLKKLNRYFCSSECFGKSPKTLKQLEALKKNGISRRGIKFSEERIINMKKAAKNRWESEEYIQKLRKAMNLKPNIGEKKLIRLIRDNKLPYKYTGDFNFWVGGKNPDFVNCNGQKKIIELFGEWWHFNKKNIPWKQTEFGTKAIYSQYGFKTLIIWDSELKDLTRVLNKIKVFDNNRMRF